MGGLLNILTRRRTPYPYATPPFVGEWGEEGLGSEENESSNLSYPPIAVRADSEAQGEPAHTPVQLDIPVPESGTTLETPNPYRTELDGITKRAMELTGEHKVSLLRNILSRVAGGLVGAVGGGQVGTAVREDITGEGSRRRELRRLGERGNFLQGMLREQQQSEQERTLEEERRARTGLIKRQTEQIGEPKAMPAIDVKIDEGYDAKGQRVQVFRKPDGTTYSVTRPEIVNPSTTKEPAPQTPHTTKFGGKVWQWNPKTKRFDIPLGADAPEGGNPPAQVPSGAQGEDVLKGLDARTAALVKGVANYEVDPKTLGYRGGKGQASESERGRILGLVKQYDPSYDQTQYGARAAIRKDFISGKAAVNIRSLNTAVGHLDTLQKAADGLGNTWAPVYNYLGNLLQTNTGDPRVVRFESAANAVESEMANIFKGTGATDQEIKSWREKLSSSQSPKQLHGAIDQLIDLMASRMDALDSQYRFGLKKPRDFRFLNDTSRRILTSRGGSAQKLLDADSGTPETEVSAPISGGKIAPEGTIIEVNGKKQIKRGGKWVPF